jgi:peptide/nickel transport system permease protein
MSVALRQAAAPSPPPLPLIAVTVQRSAVSRAWWRRLLKERELITSLVLITALVVPALLSAWWTPHDPILVQLDRRLEAPSREFLLGTDQFGRDVLSRLMVGARTSLGTATIVLVSVMTISLTLGIVAGYTGGRVDDTIMRLVDVLLALPGLVLSIAIVGVLGVGLGNLMLAVALTSWAYYARLVRGMVLQAREHEYVLAARASGADPFRIALRHVLPAISGPVLVLATLDVGRIILNVSGLSFLGLGVQAPAAEWGAMLNDGRPFFHAAPQLMIYPGLAVSLTVLAFNLAGDGLRDFFDPHQTRRVSVA